jgi:hypothetical protein
MLPDLERAERIGEFWSYPQNRMFAELLIDCEEDRTLRAVWDVAGGLTAEETRAAPAACLGAGLSPYTRGRDGRRRRWKRRSGT